jgi:hypothetical protein
VGGLSFAIALKRQLGFENFTVGHCSSTYSSSEAALYVKVFEKAHDVGGTWRVSNFAAMTGFDLTCSYRITFTPLASSRFMKAVS